MNNLIEVHAAAGQLFAKRHTVHELAGDIRYPVCRPNIMDGDDIRMVQRTSGSHLAIEVRKTLGTADTRFPNKFQPDISIKARVLGLIDRTHTSSANLA